MSNPSLSARQGMFDLEDLRLLAALGRTNTLAGAARELKLNHASAWRRLNHLERRLGVRLFERSRTGYISTVAGSEAIGLAERVLREIDETGRRLAGHDSRPTGTVRLTTTEALFGFIAPALAALRQSHPGLLVEVLVTNAFSTLMRHEADIALRPSATVPDDLIARPLATVASAIYGADRYLADKVDADPLALDWLSPDESLAHLASSKWIATHVDSARIVHRSNSLLALREAAATGMGIALLPCFLGDADRRLRRMTPPLAAITSTLWLVGHPDLRRMPRIQTVVNALAGYVSDHREVLEASRPTHHLPLQALEDPVQPGPLQG
ncbi:LysR family transcriptional regulator [Paraburkholderia caffeinilytica]|uniref:LysR family transcriptional regulator n=1 Tax=Paraburkholderia caffeinilytica TaxID=1761016 RepID=UPI0038BCF9EA